MSADDAMRPGVDIGRDINEELRAWYRRTGGHGEWFELSQKIAAAIEARDAAWMVAQRGVCEVRDRLRSELNGATAELATARAEVERLTRERDDYFGALKLAREQIEAVTADRRAILAASPAPLPTAPAPAQPPSRKDTRMNTDDIPRRARLDLNTPAELAIRSAMAAVEEAGADPRLTDAVVLLDRARNIVADYVDAAPARAAPEKPPSGFVPYPTGRPPRYNGGRLCDMWVGPCACGAWHQGADDVLERCAREPSTTPGKPTP